MRELKKFNFREYMRDGGRSEKFERFIFQILLEREKKNGVNKAQAIKNFFVMLKEIEKHEETKDILFILDLSYIKFTDDEFKEICKSLHSVKNIISIIKLHIPAGWIPASRPG